MQPNKAIVGDNAFAHEAGIHQDGVLKAAITYEIMTPRSIGRPSNELVLGKHSGRHAFRERLAELGFALEGDEFERAFKRFKDLADKKKSIFNEDLEAIVADAVVQTEERFQFQQIDGALGHVPDAERDGRTRGRRRGSQDHDDGRRPGRRDLQGGRRTDGHQERAGPLPGERDHGRPRRAGRGRGDARRELAGA